MGEKAMESQRSGFEPIPVALTREQLVSMLGLMVEDDVGISISSDERMVLESAVEALDRLGLLVREAK